MNNHRTIAASLLSLLTLLGVTASSHAGTAYVTGGTENGGATNTIYQWNTTTNTVTSVVSSATGGSLDSLIFDTQGDIIYSIIGSNAIGIYNPTTGSNRVLASGGNFSGVADMALDPSGTSFLVSNSSGGTIDRVNIATGAVTTLYSGGLRPDGLAYDSNGDLFAVLGQDEVAQLNPTTGAVIKTISTPDQPDGLTYDATTGNLYVASDGGGFYTIPTNLSSATFTSVSGSPVFDGTASDGNLLYLVVRGKGALIYNLTTGSVEETSPTIAGADDIAPVAGLGSPPAVPEPSSMVLLGSGFAILAVGAIRRKAATARLLAKTSSAA